MLRSEMSGGGAAEGVAGVALLRGSECTTLARLMRALSSDMSVVDGEITRAKTRSGRAAGWLTQLREFCATADRRRPLVVCVQDWEAIPPRVARRLVGILSDETPGGERLPFILVAGLLSTVEAVHRMLPRYLSSRATIESFRMPAGSDELDLLLSSVLLDPAMPVWLGPRALGVVLATFDLLDASIDSSSRLLRFAMFEHFFSTPLGWLSAPGSMVDPEWDPPQQLVDTVAALASVQRESVTASDVVGFAAAQVAEHARVCEAFGELRPHLQRANVKLATVLMACGQNDAGQLKRIAAELRPVERELDFDAMLSACVRRKLPLDECFVYDEGDKLIPVAAPPNRRNTVSAMRAGPPSGEQHDTATAFRAFQMYGSTFDVDSWYDDFEAMLQEEDAALVRARFLRAVGDFITTGVVRKPLAARGESRNKLERGIYGGDAGPTLRRA